MTAKALHGPEGAEAIEYLDALVRAVPHHIARAVLLDPSEQAVRHAVFDGTVLFADLVGFTRLCEFLADAGPEGLSRLSVILDRFFAAIIDQALSLYGGSVAQFGGDSITVFFDGPGHAERAAAAALGAQRLMHGEVGRTAVEQANNMKLRIGMASGRIDVPVLGDLTRRIVVCAGRAAHRALALQAYTEPGSISIDASTAELLGAAAELVERKDDRAVLRGLRTWPPTQTAPALNLGPPEAAPRKIRLLEPFVPQPLALRLRTTPSGWRIEGEMRHVVVVFSEVTGVEERNANVEGIEQMSRSMLRAYRRHAGVVAKADVTPNGHRIMVLFGLHEPSENDAEKALLASIEAASRVRQLTLPYGGKVQMRTGVHGGRVYFGAIGSDSKHDITVVGDTVNVAARCCSMAEPFEVVATEEIGKAIGAELRMSERAPVTVKGKREPIRTVVVHGPSEGVTHLAKQRGKERFMAGRDSERAQIIGVVEDAAAGRGLVVGICGEAGLGKSTMLTKLIDRWAAKGGTSVVGRCRYATRAIPLAPVTRIFETTLGLTGLRDESERRERIRAALSTYGLDGRAPELVALLQPVRQPDGSTEAAVDLADPHAQERVVSSIVQFIGERVRRQPLLYIVEDVHHADTLTLRLMCRLSTLGREWPFMCVGTYRPDPLLDDLRRTADVELMLGPLAMEDVTEMVRHERNAERVDEDLAIFVWQRTSGNPRHVVELLRFLSERELLTVRAGEVAAHPSVDALHDLVPQSLAHVTLARFATLGETTRRVLRVAAAMGRRFDRTLIDTVARHGMDGESVDAALTSLESERVLTTDGDFSYVFRDDLTRAVAYQTVPEAERRRLHARIADALDRLPPTHEARTDASLAHHRERAGQLAIAATHYERAARGAENASMNRECAQFVEAWERVCTGLREHERPGNRTLARMTLLRLVANVRMGNIRKARRASRAMGIIGPKELEANEYDMLGYWLGETARISGKPVRARRELSQVARNATDQVLRADASHALAVMAVAAGDVKLAVQWVNKALELAEEDTYRLARIALVHAGAWLVKGDLDKAKEIYERVRGSKAHREYIVLRAQATAGLARCATLAGDLPQALLHAQMGLRLARGSSRPMLEEHNLLTLGTVLMESGDYGPARDALSRAATLARELGDAIGLAQILVRLGACAVRQGETSLGMHLLVDGETRCAKAELKEAERQARVLRDGLSTNLG
ncbi:MAG: adenylate/guanylate cyclase domain-containing protein [Myxococcota bacterium]